MPAPQKPPRSSLSRRQFLKLAGLAGSALVLSACQPETDAPPTPSATPPPSPTPLSTPTPSPTLTPIPPTPSPTPSWKALVATGRVGSYAPAQVRAGLEGLLAALGGLGGLVKPGARVGIKVNLTGGTWWDTPAKPPATELFVTHPAVTGALCQLLLDAGAGSISVMDGLGDETSFERWGYTAMARPLGVRLIDLCKPDPYAGYARFPVPGQPQVYESFLLNGVLNELDVFISLAKLKVHSTTGVTLALKNLIGLAPISQYRRSPADNNRSAFHESVEFDRRLPGVIIDLNRARPIQLAVIDGIFSGQGGAGPWDAGLAQVKPGLLLAGADPLAVDTVSTAVMGFDPAAPSGQPPFVGGENHLDLARQAGLGAGLLDEIGVAGPSIQEITFKFKPAR